MICNFNLNVWVVYIYCLRVRFLFLIKIKLVALVATICKYCIYHFLPTVNAYQNIKLLMLHIGSKYKICITLFYWYVFDLRLY